MQIHTTLFTKCRYGSENMSITRRMALAGGASLAAVPMLHGCSSSRSTFSIDDIVAIEPTDEKTLSLSDYADQLGRGFDSVLGETRGVFVKGDVRETRIAPDDRDRANKVTYHLVEDQQSYSFLRAMSASARARFGSFGGGGSTSRSTFKQTSSYSIHICALARRFDRSLVLDSRSIKLSDEAGRQISNSRNRRGWTQDGKSQMLRAYGDQFVSAVTSGSELFFDLEFTCASRADMDRLKASISASYGSLVSGGGSFSQVISSASSRKTVNMTLSGIDGRGVPATISADEAQRIISRFLDNDQLNAQPIYLTPRDVMEAPMRSGSADWVDFPQRTTRQRFFDDAAGVIEYLEMVLVDADYVRRNPDEFDSQTLDRALKDQEGASAYLKLVEDAAQDAYNEFRSSGQTGPAFSRRFDVTSLGLRKYEQKTPTPQPAPQRPPPAPRRDPCGYGCRPEPSSRDHV